MSKLRAEEFVRIAGATVQGALPQFPDPLFFSAGSENGSDRLRGLSDSVSLLNKHPEMTLCGW